MAEARKASGKRRKRRQEDRAANRERARRFLSAMDRRYGAAAAEPDAAPGEGGEEDGGKGEDGLLDVHIWADCPPRLYGSTQHEGGEGGGGQGRCSERKNSMNDDPDEDGIQSPGGGGGKKKKKNAGKRGGAAGNDGGGRDGGFKSAMRSPGSGKKKAIHPRSHANQTNDPEEDSEERVTPLCRRHFFDGACSSFGSSNGGRKKGGGAGNCIFEHFSPLHGLTLFEVCGKRKPGPDFHRDDVAIDLAAASDAAAAAFAASEGIQEEDSVASSGGVEMVYHQPVRYGADGEDGQNPSDIIGTALSESNFTISSLVYVVVDGRLVFDRHRGGTLSCLEAKGADDDCTGSAGESQDGVSTGKSEREISGHHLVSHLPAQILEQIISYLPDAATAALPRVCRGWHGEIGRTSPDLWRNLLARRGWPLPCPPTIVNEGVNDVLSSSSRNLFRDAFISHYKALRDLRALVSGIWHLNCQGLVGGAVMHRPESPVAESEYAVQSYASTPGSPRISNRCVALRHWSAGRVLAAYGHDCDLHLFEAVPATSSACSGDGVVCRQAVSTRAAPFPRSRRRECSLVDMDLDDEIIACLCAVEDDPEFGGTLVRVQHRVPWLTALKKDDMLCASGGDFDTEALLRFNLRTAVADFIQNPEEQGHDFDGILEFVLHCGPSQINVTVRPGLVSCGRGRFIFEASIFTPDVEEGVEEGDELLGIPLMILRGVRLCVFSVHKGRIVQMFNSDPGGANHLVADVRLTGYQSKSSGWAVLTSSETESITIVDIERNSVRFLRIHEEIAHSLQLLILGWDWDTLSYSFHCGRPAVTTPTDLVIAHNIVASFDGRFCHRSVLTFVSTCELSVTSAACRPELLELEFEGNCVVVWMKPMAQIDHIFLLCRVNRRESLEEEVPEGTANGENIPLNPEENFDGEWFGGGDGQEGASETSIFAVLVHTPSRSVVKQLCLGYFEEDDEKDIFLTAGYETLAVELQWGGMVMAGAAVRAQGDSVDEGNSEHKMKGAKKKKKRLASHVKGRKDGFARGMSLRG